MLLAHVGVNLAVVVRLKHAERTVELLPDQRLQLHMLHRVIARGFLLHGFTASAPTLPKIR